MQIELKQVLDARHWNIETVHKYTGLVEQR